MSTPQYLIDAEAARAAAHTTLTEVAGEVDAAAERFEKARASLRSAIGAQLIDRNDPAVASRLKDAQDAETQAERDFDRANLTLEAAKENVANAEALLLAMQRRLASDIVMEAGRDLLSATKEFDKHLAAALAAVKRGSDAARLLEITARSGLEHSDARPHAWRNAAAESITDFAQSVTKEHWTPYTSRATQRALERVYGVKSSVFYAPSTPDPDFAEAR